MELSESDTRAKLIDPALHARGWTEDFIRREETAGAIEIVDGKPRKQSRGRIDYTLRIGDPSVSLHGRRSGSPTVAGARGTAGLSRRLPGLERGRGQRPAIVRSGENGVSEKGAEVVTTEKTRDLVETLTEFPAGVPYREWTIRDDNQHHYHSQVYLAESPLLIKLRWRATAKDQVHEVGRFRLHLPGLLAKRLVREEKSSRARGDVRVRFVCENGLVYLQVREGEPRLPVGRTRGA